MLKKVVSLFFALCMALGIGMPNALAIPSSTSVTGGGAVGASDHAVPVERLPVMPRGTYDFSINAGLLARSDSHIETEAPPILGSEAVWTHDGTGSLSPATSFVFQLCNVEKQIGAKRYLSTIYIDDNPRSEGRLSYTIWEPGMYYLYCTVCRADGTSSTESLTFEVDSVDGVPTVSSKVAEVVSECHNELGADASEYDVALWLHDWVTSHSHYDGTQCLHGADAILFMGTGVCDSYSKLYQRLLLEAGIDCERQTGQGNGGGHAWNVANVNGAWCQIDPTWDDPMLGGDDPVVSGWERHDYFGVNDEIMKLDHGYDGIHPCTTMANCYALVSQSYRTWFEHIWEEFAGKLDSVELSFEVSNDGVVMADDGGFYTDRDYVNRCSAVAVACMNELDWTILSHPVNAEFAYDSETQRVTCSVDLGEADVSLPTRMQTIGASAFDGDKELRTVEVCDGVTSVGDQAFARCDNLFWIRIPESVTDFGEDVFEGLDGGHFMVICEKGGAVEAYCEANGIVTCTG